MKQLRSMCDLPSEILTEIFLKSPAKTLISCKCVCKSFRDIIRNPNFVRTHDNLTRTHSHDSTTSIMLHLINKPFHPYHENHHLLLSIDNATNDIISYPIITNPPIPNVGVYDHVCVVGSCNGLICIAVWCNHGGRKDELLFLLWNPAIGQSRFLPKPKYSTMISPNVVIEFGYVLETNDYVVVKLDGREQVRVEVYKSSLDSWRVIDCTSVFKKHVSVRRDESSVFLNGCFHWRATGYRTNYIISYKLANEKVELIKALDNGVVQLDNWKLTALEDSLAMLYYNSKPPHQYELWIMNDYNVHDSWALRFRIGDDSDRNLRPLGCLRNGVMITYEIHYFVVYLHDMNTGQKTKISAVPDGWMINGFSSFSETLLPLC